jgi:hypothetical protein
MEQVAVARKFWTDVMEGGRSADVAADGLWEGIMNDVAIVIKTGKEVSHKRLNVMRKHGWMSLGRRVPNLLVVSDVDGEGVVGMKRYGQELLREDAKKIDFEVAPAVSGAGHNANTSQASGVDPYGASRVTSEDLSMVHPKKWFTLNGWRGDKDKNLPAFHLLRAVYPGKKWYLMLDDDTYVYLDSFAELTSHHSSPKDVATPFYTGKTFYVSNCGSWDRDGKNLVEPGGPRATFAHGGSGIVLNGAAMDRLYRNVPQCIRKHSICWAGDVQVSLCLRQAGVEVVQYTTGSKFEKHFTPFSPSTALKDSRYETRWRSSERPITFHKAPVREVKLLAEFERRCLRDRVPVLYNSLRHFLVEERGISAKRHGKRPHKRR